MRIIAQLDKELERAKQIKVDHETTLKEIQRSGLSHRMCVWGGCLVGVGLRREILLDL